MDDSKELIAYCGLYCGDCFNYKGEIADLSRDLRKKLRQTKFDVIAQGLSGFFKEFKDYPQCYAVLGALVKLRCKRGCRNGGGNPACKIRICCQKKNITGCWECVDVETCTKMDFLKPVHGDAIAKNLKNLKKYGEEKFLKGTRYY